MRDLVVSIAAVAATIPMQAHAQEWETSVTPYFMVPIMDGKAGVGPVDARVHANPSDIFSNLNWGAMGILEVNNGRIGFAIDATYMNLETTRDGTIDRIGGHQGAYTGMFLARIDPNAEVYVGARVNDLGLKISGTGPLGVQRSASQSKTWVDPLVGMRVILPFNDKTDLTVLGDVGGFGVGSDIAVQAWPSLGFRLSSSVKAQLGYRIVYVDYESGSGLRRFKYAMVTHGPTAGVQFRF